jgi:hypothetical protein
MTNEYNRPTEANEHLPAAQATRGDTVPQLYIPLRHSEQMTHLQTFEAATDHRPAQLLILPPRNRVGTTNTTADTPPRNYRFTRTLLDTATTVMAPSQIAKISLEDQQHVLRAMPSVSALPRITELDAHAQAYGAEPYLLREQATIGGLRTHLLGAAATNREIEINVFPDDAHVLRVGGRDGFDFHDTWDHFAKHAEVTMHTHPGLSGETEWREPSLQDLGVMRFYRRPELIASADGMTLCKPPSGAPKRLWADYINDVRGLDSRSYKAYGKSKVYSEFIRDVIRPAFTEWAKLDNNMTLRDVQDHMSSLEA